MPNKDGFEPGQPVTFEDIIRSRRKDKGEVQEKPAEKPKSRRKVKDDT